MQPAKCLRDLHVSISLATLKTVDDLFAGVWEIMESSSAPYECNRQPNTENKLGAENESEGRSCFVQNSEGRGAGRETGAAQGDLPLSFVWPENDMRVYRLLYMTGAQQPDKLLTLQSHSLKAKCSSEFALMRCSLALCSPRGSDGKQ